MKIRGLRIEPAVFAAPMAGITDSPFRRTLRRLGCPAVFTEMLSAEGLTRGNRRSLDMLRHDAEEHPIFAQLFGARPEALAESARLCAEAGFDGLDVNMGCPVPKVVRSGAGAALMREPLRAEAVVRAVRAAVELPLGVKLRAGWSAGERNAVELAERLAGAGADLVCLHPRTRSQLYSGRADWSLIGRCARAVDVPVIGNGDLFEPADAARMRDSTGCAGVMVGRGLLGNPWLAAAMADPDLDYPPSCAERLRVFCTHLDDMIAFLGSEAPAVLRMRKHLAWYGQGLAGIAELRRRLHTFETAADMKSAMQSLTRSKETARP
ncbi:MAG: tRNA dihydrouridine synthase DusB [Deltaproteobacteria bacterium]|nr:tRNA dihydrouridine synthase DusB [Deltaproteobacteria bacterium]